LSIQESGKLGSNVELVTYEGKLHVYKFMTRDIPQQRFEVEVQRYHSLEGVQGIPEFKGLVQSGGVLQGFLISYIEGVDLWRFITETGEIGDGALLDIARRIIELCAELERREFYHQDLKCPNIVRRKCNGEIFFIDFGPGLSGGMYREERGADIRRGKITAEGGVYILGKTLWQLWCRDLPTEENQLERVECVPARRIISDCLTARFNTIGNLYSEHYLRSPSA
jgi:hypothetical protein